jgi:pimeloyl-ACP methyl ester carboxylesterase
MLAAMSRMTDGPADPAGFIVLVGNGERIHFLDWNAADGAGPVETSSSRPGIILVHGLSATAWVWAPVARRLAAERHTVALDLPGHGLSDAPTDVDAYSSEALAEAVVATAEGARIVGFGAGDAAHLAEGRAVVVGHGFGAAVAALGAARMGERCAGLVLVDGGWESLADTTGLEPDEFLWTIEEPPEVMASLAAFLADRRGFDPRSWDEDQERAARATVVELPVGRVVPSVRPHALEATVRTAFAYDPRVVLAAVRAPIVALAAADDEDGTHARSLDRTQAFLAAADGSAIRVVRFAADGHNLMRYRPAEVTAAILGIGRE